jgi:cell division protein FtsI (penicillin-binding protein 3)
MSRSTNFSTFALFFTAFISTGCASFDARVQHAAREELDRAVAEWQPKAAVVVIIDPNTGYVVASEGRVGGKSDPSLASRKAYVTGSTLKTFTIAAALEERAIGADAVVDCATRMYAGAELHDGTPHGTLSLTDVLVTSSNVGTSRVYDALGLARLRATLQRFHIGEPPARAATISGARDEMRLAIGELAEATPMQVSAGYAAIVNDGVYLAPTFTRTTPRPERVLRPETAQTMLAMRR